MLSQAEQQLARIALQRRYLTGTQLCVCVESRRTSSESLDKIFVDQGFLTREEVDELMRLSRAEAVPAPMFGDLLRERGLASERQIHEASALKARLATQNIHRFLGEILVERRVISPEHVTELLAQQGRHGVECTGCGYRFSASHGRGYACPECNRPIEPPAPRSAIAPLPLTIREEMGRGPSGSVLRAFDETLRQEIALKILQNGRRPSELSRRAATLSHPNIARTLEFDSWNGDPCILTEFVDGIPLYDHVVGNVRLPIEDAIPLLKQIAAGLGAAHAQGIPHGNLKARNVIILESREAKVTDFGLAPGRSEPVCADLQLYLAPERLREGPSIAADLYACGVLWYFMLTGAQPFAAPSLREIRRRQAQAKTPPLHSRVPGLSFGCQAIFLRLTFAEPLLRYRSAAALQDDLDRLENGDIPLAERELRSPRSR